MSKVIAGGDPEHCSLKNSLVDNVHHNAREAGDHEASEVIKDECAKVTLFCLSQFRCPGVGFSKSGDHAGGRVTMHTGRG